MRVHGSTANLGSVLNLDIEGTKQLALTKSVVVHPIRRYIEHEPARPAHLLTVRGVGYRFVAAPGSPAA